MAETERLDDTCQVCGYSTFVHTNVLWPDLIQEWELSPAEAAYIDVQQGTRCERCGTNVRSQALARALMRATDGTGTLERSLQRDAVRDLQVLEINEAGSLTSWLSSLPGHILARYPDCDVMQLPYAAAAFDLVIHSDTLEHVADPHQGLRECRRVLVPGGSCVFTVPIVAGRLTRSRRGLPASYHGSADCREQDFIVHTEFGSDVWTAVFEAGFASCQFVSFRYPAGLALIARR